jgi:hypothetical protein
MHKIGHEFIFRETIFSLPIRENVVFAFLELMWTKSYADSYGDSYADSYCIYALVSFRTENRIAIRFATIRTGNRLRVDGP